MKPKIGINDPAFPIMAMDILNNVLSHADSPGTMGACLTEEVRELTGARCVMLIQCLGAAHRIDHRVVSVNPLRMLEWAESADRKRLYEAIYKVPSAMIIPEEEPSDITALLLQDGFRLSMLFPLRAGGFRVGAMLVLGLPDEERINSVLNLIGSMSTIVSLVLRNAILYEKQEQIIFERTVELREKNEKLATELCERIRIEGELQKLNSELDIRVRERTAQLEAANRELESFSYTVAHDLRAPLRHLNGFLELLHREIDNLLNEEGRHYMKVIFESAGSMGRLIDDFLNFARMGRVEMTVTAVELRALVRQIISEYETETAGRAINWSIAELPAVTGDAVMLKTVFANLISNSLKFTKNREQAEIEIGCLHQLDRKIAIYVRDNGVGFDMKYVGKLFGVFQRLHKAEEFEGTGIGLANVRRIINRHGGRTWAEGEIDRGAIFYFSLPYTTKEE